MRRKDREITNIDEIEGIIKKAICCRIALVDKDEPYIIPVSFGYEKDTLYFHSALEGHKAELIRNNNNICFEIDTDVEVIKGEKPCQWAMKYRSVIGKGKASILKNGEEKAHGLSVIVKHYAESDFSFSKSELDPVLVVRVDIERITGKQSGY